MLEATTGVTAGESARTATRARPEEESRSLLARLAVMSLLEAGRPVEARSSSGAEAGAVARAWLDLIHSGRAASSWAVAAPALRRVVELEAWQAALRALRVGLGRCRSRRLESLSTFEGFPGLPRAHYVVVRFESEFEGRGGVTETVTTCRGDDGHWRATAYFVR